MKSVRMPKSAAEGDAVIQTAAGIVVKIPRTVGWDVVNIHRINPYNKNIIDICRKWSYNKHIH